jgi:K+-transporting ATPase ATPase C chain
MKAQIRANLILVVATLLLCSVLYPLAVWAIGQGLFADQANGSLLSNDKGQVIGSRLIAQPFKGQGYFWPRPSAAGSGYDASASGASNFGANNMKLRDRVARQLGPLVRYNSGPKQNELVGPDIVAWFIEQTDPARVKPGVNDLVTRWASTYTTPARSWLKNDNTLLEHVANWPNHASLVKEWQKKNPGATGPPKPEDLADLFFADFAREYPGQWLLVSETDEGGKSAKRVKPLLVKAVKQPAANDEEEALLTDIQATFFEPWLQANPAADLEKVPADMVTASGSGLDPHITLANAHYQSRRVVKERTKAVLAKLGNPKALRPTIESKVSQVVEEVVQKHATTTVANWNGGPALLNVLEVNLALDVRVKELGERLAASATLARPRE